MKTYWTLLIPVLFLVLSIPLFTLIYNTTQSVIDEEFHLRQGLHFCNKRFDVWDPKITTFPGLYLFSLILNPLSYCTVLGLRAISLAAATVNVFLIIKIKRRLQPTSSNEAIVLDTISLAIIPPIYFFSFLYYTDTISLTTVLLFYWFWLKESQLTSAVFAAASVLMRQTNIIWVVMFFGITALESLRKVYATANGIKLNEVNIFQFKIYRDVLTSYKLIFAIIWKIIQKGYYYLLIILPFIVFVALNGSIVLGDKSAHVATLHLPQLFYFSIFTLVFNISSLMRRFTPTTKWILRNKFLFAVLIAIGAFIVRYNTLEHPYLLADNRHYTFYIWHRFYRRYSWFKYAMVPVYMFALALIAGELQQQQSPPISGSLKLMYSLSLIAVLCFQRLLDVRYFFIPYIIYRLQVYAGRNRSPQWIEIIYYVLMNAITFYVFVTKEIIWKDFDEPQRLIW